MLGKRILGDRSSEAIDGVLRALLPPLDRDEPDFLHQALVGRGQRGSMRRDQSLIPGPVGPNQRHARFAQLQEGAMGSRGCGAGPRQRVPQVPPELDDASAAMHVAHHRASSGHAQGMPSSVTMGSTSGKRVGG